MRKILIAIMAIVIIILPSCRAAHTERYTSCLAANPSWAEVGVEWDIMHDRLIEHGYEVGGIYTYYTAGRKNDRLIVARNQHVADDTGKTLELAVEIRSYIINEPLPPDNFLQIEPGMDLFDVVELIGQIPMTADSAIGTVHEDSVGNVYRILWFYDESLQKLVVGSVNSLNS